MSLFKENNIIKYILAKWPKILFISLLTILFVVLLGFIPGFNFLKQYGYENSIHRSSFRTHITSILWENPKLLPGSLNEIAGNSDVTISADGQTIIITHKFSKNNTDLYTSKLIQGKWSKPQPLLNINTKYNELAPEISSNSKFLFFSSNRPGGRGKLDIWVSSFEGKEWSDPILLQGNVNTKYNESYPSLSPDGTILLLASDRPTTLSRNKKDYVPNYDIYQSELVRQNGAQKSKGHILGLKYQTAHNVKELNSPYNELKASITKNGNIIYLASNRPGGYGGYDIYKSQLLENQFIPPINFGAPINSKFDEISPTISMKGFEVYFASNKYSRNRRYFQVFDSTSRIIFAEFDWNLLLQLTIIVSLLLFTILAIFLLFKLMVSNINMRTIIKCLLAAIIIHLIIAALSSFWFITTKLTNNTNLDPDTITININNLARESIALSIKEGVASLPKIESTSAVSEQANEKIPIAIQKPASQIATTSPWQVTITESKMAPVSMANPTDKSQYESQPSEVKTSSTVTPSIIESIKITLEAPSSPKKSVTKNNDKPSKGLPAIKKPDTLQQQEIFKIKGFDKEPIKIAFKEVEGENEDIVGKKTPEPTSEVSLVKSDKIGVRNIEKGLKKELKPAIHAGSYSVLKNFNSKSGTFIFPIDYKMVLPGKPEIDITLHEPALLKSNKSFTERIKILLPIYISKTVSNKMLKEYLIKSNKLNFATFDIVLKLALASDFTEPVGGIIYAQMPGIRIPADSELEVPENYILNDKVKSYQ